MEFTSKWESRMVKVEMHVILEYIKEIKGELESLHGVKLSRKTTDTQVRESISKMTLICA
jgi:hypothetical protein